MNFGSQMINEIARMQALQVPVFVVCLVGLAMSIARRQQAPAAASWAMLGFGVALLTAFAWPIGQALVIEGLRGSNGSPNWALMMTAMTLLTSIFRAASYGFLLAAVFAGRSRPPATVA